MQGLLLDICINLLALSLVDFHSRLLDPGVDLGIRVIAAIAATRCETLAVEGIFEYLGILVGASYPAQRVDLKGGFHNLGIKRGELKSTYLKVDSRIMYLLLQSYRQQS